MAEVWRLPGWLRFGALPIGNQCLLMLAAGALLGLTVPGAAPLLQPLGLAFLQASQVVVMPFLICELIAGFGGLSSEARRALLRGGVLVLLALWLVAALVVIVLPSFLPSLVYSGFFRSDLFLEPETADLLRTYLPDNIFAALAADNFPAVVLFSSVLGILLQGMDERQQLLPVLEAMRRLFARLNRLVARIIPYGILALSTLTFSRLDLAQLVRIQALFQLGLIALLVLSVLFSGVVLAFTPLTAAGLWRIVRGPLALTASSANLLIALPLLIEGLREELDRLPPTPEAATGGRAEDLSPLISLGYALPTVGQVVSLLFIPFAAWSVDRALTPLAIARMLVTAVPSSVAGMKAVVRQELLSQGLPLDLLQLVYVSGEWLYRLEKVLALEGLVVLALLVHFGATVHRVRLLPLVGGAGAAAALLLGLGSANRAVLAHLLRGSYRNDARLMALTPVVPAPVPAPLPALRPQPVTLRAILARRVLRVGVRRDGLPWAFRNRQGRLVGYDIDLMASLARDLEVRLQVREGSLAELERWLQQDAIDLAVGGIQASPQRAIRQRLSRGYQAVHLGLVVPDGTVGMVQNLPQHPLGRPLRVAVADADSTGPELRDRIARELGGSGTRPVVELVSVPSKDVFFTPAGQQRFDALLTTAEGGSAWAVLHPRTSLLAAFRDRLGSEMVVGVAGDDQALTTYLDTWLARAQARGLTTTLFRRWILAEP
ncbi:cation:dicarboxylase symporter family transporter [Cyanobium sp. FGCU-6]|nr:cation:dicarboxylase symporter family transporter [Cyanobium sp. FGCU6]